MLGRLVLRGVAVAVFSVVMGAGVGCTQLDTFSTTGDGTLDPGASFVSNAQAPVVKNTFVREGVSWARESVHPIMWEVPQDLGRIDDFVTVSMSSDGGAQYTPLDQITTSDRYYRWTLPSQGNEKVRFRVTFHKSDDQGNITALRHLDTPDVTLTASQKKKYVWTQVAKEAPFGPRDGGGGVVFGGKMWLLGGWNPGVFAAQCANDVWSSKDGATWVQERPNTFKDPNAFDHKKDWEGRHYAGYHVFGGQMWIVGGDPLQGRYQTDIWSSPDGKTWTRRDVYTSTPRKILVTNPDNPLYGQYIVDETSRPVEAAQFGLRTVPITGTFKNKLFVMGGQRMVKYVDPEYPGAPAKAFNDIWQSTDGGTFTALPTEGPMWSPRGFVSESVEFRDRMWVIGGGLTDDPAAGREKLEFNNDVWSTPDGVRWEESKDRAPFSPRFWHNVKVFDDRLWVINGYDGPDGGQGSLGDNLRDVWYSTDGSNWYEASPPEVFAPRHAGTAWVHEGALYVGSGNAFGPDAAKPDQAKWFADVWKMAPAP
jgi:hypothetical protein